MSAPIAAAAGDRREPGPHDPAGHAPAHRREPARRADAHDRAGDGVRGADADAERGGGVDRDRGARLRGEAVHGLELRDLAAHGVDDAPAARERAEPDRGVGGDHHPERDREFGQVAGGEEHAGDDAHRLLRVVRAVHQAVGRGREQLEPPEPAVHLARRRVPEDPVVRGHQREAGREPDQRRQHHEHERLGPAGRDDRAEAGLRDRRARVAAEQRVRGAGGQPVVPGEQVPEDRAGEAGEDHAERHHARDRSSRCRPSWRPRCRRRTPRRS